MSMNVVILQGRLTRDPEERYNKKNEPVVRFSLAVDRRFEKDENGDKKTDFIDCVVFGKTAGYVSSYVKKGDMVTVRGHIRIDDWVDKSGNKRKSFDVIVDEISTSGRRAEAPNNYAKPIEEKAEENKPVFEELTDDDVLPF